MTEEQTDYEDIHKDTSTIPIILDITAKISKREPSQQNPDLISLMVNGTAGPYVSSGSFFGACSSHDTVEEATNSLHEWIKQQKQWFIESYARHIIVKSHVENEVNKLKQSTLV